MTRLPTSRALTVLSAVVSAFLMIHGALNLFRVSPIRDSLTLLGIVLVSVLAAWGIISLLRRGSA